MAVLLFWVGQHKVAKMWKGEFAQECLSTTPKSCAFQFLGLVSEWFDNNNMSYFSIKSVG